MPFQDFKLFDTHLHIIDNHFPLIPNNRYLPDAFTCEDYLNRMKGYTLAGGAIVSGSFQAFDQTYLVDALKRLGPSFVGVTQLPATVSDEELLSSTELVYARSDSISNVAAQRKSGISTAWRGGFTNLLAGMWSCTLTPEN